MESTDIPSTNNETASKTNAGRITTGATKEESHLAINDHELAAKLDSYSLESIVELKISRFLDQIGTYYPENLHSLIIRKAEKPLINKLFGRGQAPRIN